MTLDGVHVVDARRTSYVASEAEGQGSGLFPMFLRNGVAVLGVTDCGQKVLVECTHSVAEYAKPKTDTHIIFIRHERLDALNQAEARCEVRAFPVPVSAKRVAFRASPFRASPCVLFGIAGVTTLLRLYH